MQSLPDGYLSPRKPALKIAGICGKTVLLAPTNYFHMATIFT
jgi:hypothetical protein